MKSSCCRFARAGMGPGVYSPFDGDATDPCGFGVCPGRAWAVLGWLDPSEAVAARPLAAMPGAPTTLRTADTRTMLVMVRNAKEPRTNVPTCKSVRRSKLPSLNRSRMNAMARHLSTRPMPPTLPSLDAKVDVRRLPLPGHRDGEVIRCTQLGVGLKRLLGVRHLEPINAAELVPVLEPEDAEQ